MHHRRIQDRLILYIDGELSDAEMASIRGHLQQCPACRRSLERLSAVWLKDEAAGRLAPPPYLWTRVAARVHAMEQHGSPADAAARWIMPLIRPAVMVATLIIGIVLGAYLGNIPATQTTEETSTSQMAAQDTNGFLNPVDLESFADLPPGSGGRAYMLIMADTQGERR